MAKHPKTTNYEIGYKKPPKSGQFKPGQSGNKKGRPKGSKNFKTDLAEELAETISITEGGKPKKITKQKAIIKSTVAKAIKGDIKATNTLFGMVLKILIDTIETDETDDLSETDQAILDHFKTVVLNDALKNSANTEASK